MKATVDGCTQNGKGNEMQSRALSRNYDRAGVKCAWDEDNRNKTECVYGT